MQIKSTPRLLVLDDDPNVAATICATANMAGFETDQACNIDIFLTKLHFWNPSHLIIDLQLENGKDGIHIIQYLGQIASTASIIIVSGLGGRIIEAAARSAVEHSLNLIGTLSKPFSGTALKTILLGENHNWKTVTGVARSYNQNPISQFELIRAIQEKKFTAYFQPKITCADKNLVGFECLARWIENDEQYAPPSEFIKVAETTGLIHKLTRELFHQVLSNPPEQVRSRNMKLALNISSLNLEDKDFPQWLLDECINSNIDPSSVIIELTESASMQNQLALLEELTQLRIKGFGISIDDFGTGYASLVQLACLPFSELKIGQEFVKPLQYSEEARKIVKTVIGLGRSLELNVVAEGVEDEWALNFLRDMGCDEAQGYYIAYPMNCMAASAWGSPQREA